MAMSSGIFVNTFKLAITDTTLDMDADTTPANWRIILVNNSVTPDYTTDVGYTGTWSTNEVTGTGWNGGAAGGHLLSTAATGATSTAPTVTASAGALVYDMGDVSVASTTLTGAYGCMIYQDSLTSNNGLVGVSFGGSYSTSNGTFGIQWNGSGIFSVDLVP